MTVNPTDETTEPDETEEPEQSWGEKMTRETLASLPDPNDMTEQTLRMLRGR